jgi:hypothetical protein
LRKILHLEETVLRKERPRSLFRSTGKRSGKKVGNCTESGSRVLVMHKPGHRALQKSKRFPAFNGTGIIAAWKEKDRHDIPRV